MFPSIGPVEVVAPVRKMDGEVRETCIPLAIAQFIDLATHRVLLNTFWYRKILPTVDVHFTLNFHTELPYLYSVQGADCYEVTSCYRWSARAEAPQFSTAPRKPRYTPYCEYVGGDVGGGGVQLHGTMSASASTSASAHYWDRYLQQRVILSPEQVASKVSRMLLPSQPGDVRNKEGGGRKAREGKGKKEDTGSTHEAKGAMEMKVVGKRKARDEKKGKEGTAVRKKATAEAGAGEVAAN